MVELQCQIKPLSWEIMRFVTILNLQKAITTFYIKKSYKTIVILNVENKVEKLFTSNKKNYIVIIIRNIKI
jgi:hypothetical protein